MGYNQRRLSRIEATTDRELILKFMRSKISLSDFQRLRGPFFLYSLYGLGKNAEITARLWKKYGPALLAQHHEPFPENICHILTMHGWPEGSGKVGDYVYCQMAGQTLERPVRKSTSG